MVADGDDLRVAVEFGQAAGDAVHRHVDAALDAAVRVFVRFAHIQKQRRGFGGLQEVVELLRGHLAHRGFSSAGGYRKAADRAAALSDFSEGGLFHGDAAFLHGAEHGLADVGRVAGDVMAQLFHGVHLGAGGIGLAGDDGAGVAHAAARRRGDTGHEANQRLTQIFPGPAGGGDFLRSADLADHDDDLGFRIGFEGLEHGDEVGAVDGIAADADGGGNAQAEVGHLLGGLVVERARAGDDADVAFFVDMRRHDADLALAGGDDAGRVRADDDGVLADPVTLQTHHVVNRDAVGDGDGNLDAGVDGFHQGVGIEGRRHEDGGDIGAGGGDGFGDRVEDRQPQMRGAALAGGDAADDLGTHADGVLSVEGGVLAGKALKNDLGVFIDEDAHGLIP